MKIISKARYMARGFTALELIIVITIIGISTAIAMPQYSVWRDSAATRQVSWEIKHKMKFVRERAITTNRQTEFQFLIQNGLYRLVQGDLAAGSGVWTVIAPWQDINPQASLSTGVDCTGVADVNIGFNPNGSANTSNYICIKDSSGTTRFRLVINRINGSILIR